jgi:hypothetical protein
MTTCEGSVGPSFDGAAGRCLGGGETPSEAEIREALDAVETGVRDARGDYPNVSEDDLYHEIAGSIAAQYGEEVGAEVRRRLGF